MHSLMPDTGTSVMPRADSRGRSGAAAQGAPAAERGPYGMALRAAYAVQMGAGESLEDFLASRVLAGASGSTVEPDSAAAAAFGTYIQRYKALLQVERAAVELL